MAEARLRILHISDLHVRVNEVGPRGWRRRQVLGDAWRRNLDELARDEPLDLVCFTGDLAQSGKAAEYELVGQFVDELLEHARVPRERLFVVPGNHDIDRALSPEAWNQLRSVEEHEAQLLSGWMSSERGLRGIPDAYRDEILVRQSAYRAWIANGLKRPDLLPNAETGHPRLGYRVTLEGWRYPVHIIGLDSAWLAGDDSDQGKLRLTPDQVGFLTGDLAGFRIALIHHPLTDLADGEECRGLLADRVDLLLRGHLHQPNLSLWSDPDRRLHELAAGCLYQHRTYPNACQRIDVTFDEAGRPSRYDVRFRSWSLRGHWYDDGGVYREAVNGRYTWSPPPVEGKRTLGGPAGAPPGAQPVP